MRQQFPNPNVCIQWVPQPEPVYRVLPVQVVEFVAVQELVFCTPQPRRPLPAVQAIPYAQGGPFAYDQKPMVAAQQCRFDGPPAPKLIEPRQAAHQQRPDLPPAPRLISEEEAAALLARRQGARKRPDRSGAYNPHLSDKAEHIEKPFKQPSDEVSAESTKTSVFEPVPSLFMEVPSLQPQLPTPPPYQLLPEVLAHIEQARDLLLTVNEQKRAGHLPSPEILEGLKTALQAIAAPGASEPGRVEDACEALGHPAYAGNETAMAVRRFLPLSGYNKPGQLDQEIGVAKQHQMVGIISAYACDDIFSPEMLGEVIRYRTYPECPKEEFDLAMISHSAVADGQSCVKRFMADYMTSCHYYDGVADKDQKVKADMMKNFKDLLPEEFIHHVLSHPLLDDFIGQGPYQPARQDGLHQGLGEVSKKEFEACLKGPALDKHMNAFRVEIQQAQEQQQQAYAAIEQQRTVVAQPHESVFVSHPPEPYFDIPFVSPLPEPESQLQGVQPGLQQASPLSAHLPRQRISSPGFQDQVLAQRQREGLPLLENASKAHCWTGLCHKVARACTGAAR